MRDVIVTGASRGIGRALVEALAARGGEPRLVLVGRDRERLEALAASVGTRGARAVVVAGDLGTVAGAQALGEQLAGRVEAGATLVHNAGLWPSRCQRTADGLEESFAVNALGPLVLQRPLLAAGRLGRILVVSAGLITLGRFDAARTPTGDDFSALRTYASTKLALAVAMRDVAAAHPGVDVRVMHPGVVRTDLGARPGWLGRLLARVKRSWEPPEACGQRLARVLASPERWSPAGEASWWFEETVRPWPGTAEGESVRAAVREATRPWLGSSGALFS